MARKKLPEADGPEVPEWIVTFTDMISLLVTFFVLIMSFSSMDDDEVISLPGALSGSAGSIEDSPVPGDPVAMPNQRVDKTHATRGIKDAHSRPPEELPEDIAEMGTATAADQIEMDLSSIGDGLSIEFGADCYFSPGSIEVPPTLARNAAELGAVLSAYPFMVMLEGFTDDAFQPTVRFPTAEALGLARAAAVADIMTGVADLEPMKVLLNGPAMDRPIGDNTTATGRRLNRRVSVRILALSKSREAFLSSERKRLQQEQFKRKTEGL